MLSAIGKRCRCPIISSVSRFRTVLVVAIDVMKNINASGGWAIHHVWILNWHISGFSTWMPSKQYLFSWAVHWLREWMPVCESNGVCLSAFWPSRTESVRLTQSFQVWDPEPTSNLFRIPEHSGKLIWRYKLQRLELVGQSLKPRDKPPILAATSFHIRLISFKASITEPDYLCDLHSTVLCNDHLD